MSVPRTTSTTSPTSERALASAMLVMLALSIMLGLGGCTKDSLREVVKAPSTPLIGEPFMPEPENIMPMILAANERKLSYVQGVRDCSEEEPLQEAIWLAEALMNYEKGDASRYGEDWITDSVNYSFPVSVRPDGSVWIRECDFFSSYQDAMAQVELAAGGNRVYMLDHSFVSIEDGIANILIEWTDRDPGSEFPDPWSPNGAGWECMSPEQGGIAIKHLIRHNFHGVAPPAGSVIVNVTSVYHYDAVTELGYFGSYPYYLGTSEALGGQHLFYSGPGSSTAICFPEWWDRYLIVREIVEDDLGFPAHLSFVREQFWAEYIPRTGQPMSYGSPFYPMGPWDFQWEFRIGYVLNPIGPE